MLATKTPLIVLALWATAAWATPAQADVCAVTLDTNDQQLHYSIKKLQVPPACSTYAITLRHTGKLPRTAMGHNVVVTAAAHVRSVAEAGLKAGAAHHYVEPGDVRVLAASQLVGGGERTTIYLNVALLKPGTEYTYFCTFPGHSFSMRGMLRLQG